MRNPREEKDQHSRDSSANERIGVDDRPPPDGTYHARVGVGEIAVVVGAYAIGSFPTAQLVGRRVGHDPLLEGSGNPGASNVYRTAGRAAGLVVLLGDAAKGAVPTLVALLVAGRGLAAVCWLAAVVGHVAPLRRGLRGGKGVATAAGGAAILYPVIALALGAVFALVVRRRRVPALGSLAMAVLLPVLVAVTGHPGWESAVAVTVSALVISRHHGNIRRLLSGTERSLPGR